MTEIDFSRTRAVRLSDGTWSPTPRHVLDAVEIAVRQPYGLFGDRMGYMKTAQAIITAQVLREQGTIDRVIVLSPASVRPVWFDRDLGQLAEQLWLPGRVTEFHSKDRWWEHTAYQTEQGEQKAEGPRLDWIVSNYEYVRRKGNRELLYASCGPKTFLILDESSALKGYDSLQTKACMDLRYRCGRCWLLNGTAVGEHPGDLFAQANLMHWRVLDCKYITHFRARYAVMGPVLGAGGKPLTSAWGKPIQGVKGWQHLDDLERRLAPYVVRREGIVTDFATPHVPIEVRLSVEEWRVYREMRDQMVVELESGQMASTQQAAVKAMRLAQITSGYLGGVEDDLLSDDGPVLDLYDDAAPEFDSSAPARHVALDGEADRGPRDDGRRLVEVGRSKLDALIARQRQMLEEEPDLKLLVWFRFVEELRRYLREAAQFGHPLGAVCGQSVFGRSVRDERAEALRLLHPGTAPAGPATVGAIGGTGAMGLNFTAFHTNVDCSYDHSALKKSQQDARTNRPGQRHQVRYLTLVAVGPKGQKTVDHGILMARQGKIDLANATMAAWVKVIKEE